MRLKATFTAGPGALVLLFLLAAFATARAEVVKELRFEAFLIWATDADHSPNSSHKPVGQDIQKKLKDLPLKWANYFQVNHVGIAVPPRGSGRVTLSDKCQIEVGDVNGKYVEVSLIGKGEPVLKRTQALPKGELLVLGGNAPNSTGWLVVLKRTE